ncbi:MAG: Hint domain-containing protein [Bacteroidota bacterium]
MKTSAHTCLSIPASVFIRKPLHQFLLILLSLQLASSGLMAQTTAEVRGLTMDDYTKAKAFKIKDLEVDTYAKFDGLYVLDRYDRGTGQIVPPYVFKYSDGIERRIYLYKFLDNKSKKELGLLAVYTTPANGKTINVCIPNPSADKSVWAAYIDDLKQQGEQEKGFLSTVSYVLSRELSAVAANGGQTTTIGGAKSDYDVCFPAGTLVTLADGSQLAIEKVDAGTKVLAYQTDSQQPIVTEVEERQTHEGKSYSITRLVLFPTEEITATTAPLSLSVSTLEATPNHPVWTNSGRQTVKQLLPGDILYSYNSQTDTFQPMKVQQVLTSYNTVSRVYHLKTTVNNYLVNGMVVLEK